MLNISFENCKRLFLNTKYDLRRNQVVLLYFLHVFIDNVEFDVFIFYLKSLFALEYSVRIKETHVFCLTYLVLKNMIVAVSTIFEELELQNCLVKVKF